jgi:glycosyltransferase involved in cell wall biosynthesis
MRLCFIVQRYGREVNGGAESLCREVAEHLAKYVPVDVVTTCAIDYVTWKDEYAPGVENQNGVTVRRFQVDHERDIVRFNAFSEGVFCHPHSYEDEIEWMKQQGPYSSPLLEFLAENRTNYDAFIFFTYLYCTTFFGLPLVCDRALLVPAAHDEPPIYLSIFDDLFHAPRAILYNTEEEKHFVTSKFDTGAIPSEIIGTGIDGPEDIDPSAFEQKYGVRNFIIYVGRIDESKGCKELFNYFIRYKSETNSPIKLVLLGRAVMDVPENPDIVPLGFVSDLDKYNGILASELLVMPSPFESLSIVLLEAWHCMRPVLVNGNCAVLKGQCSRSNAGLWYRNYDEFKECLDLLHRYKELRDLMGKQGKKFVEANYRWEIVEKKYLQSIGTFIARRK